MVSFGTKQGNNTILGNFHLRKPLGLVGSVAPFPPPQLECFLPDCGTSPQFSDAPCLQISCPGIGSFCSSCLYSVCITGQGRRCSLWAGKIIWSSPIQEELSYPICSVLWGSPNWVFKLGYFLQQVLLPGKPQDSPSQSPRGRDVPEAERYQSLISGRKNCAD